MHILVADDHIDLLELLCIFLRRAGYLVSTCQTPGDALQLLENENPDVLMVDATLEEEGDGLQLLRTALDRKPSLRTVVFSADRMVEPRARAAGAHLVLFKPAAPDAILASLEKLLRAPHDG